MRVLPTVLTAVMLTGCQTVGTSLGPNIVEVGYTQISPTSNVEVGHLYFSGEGYYPRFKTIKGKVFNEMCYDDYRKDRQLKRIDSYISERGKVRSEAIYDAKGNLYASANSGSIADLAGITLAGGLDSSTLFNLTNLRILSLSETGVHVVRQNIGKGCRAKIREFQADGRQVVLILEAQRADSASEIRVQGANANIGGSVGGTVADDKGKLSVKGKGASFGGGVKVSTTSKSNDLYVSVNLMDLLAAAFHRPSGIALAGPRRFPICLDDGPQNWYTRLHYRGHKTHVFRAFLASGRRIPSSPPPYAFGFGWQAIPSNSHDNLRSGSGHAFAKSAYARVETRWYLIPFKTIPSTGLRRF